MAEILLPPLSDVTPENITTQIIIEAIKVFEDAYPDFMACLLNGYSFFEYAYSNNRLLTTKICMIYWKNCRCPWVKSTKNIRLCTPAAVNIIWGNGLSPNRRHQTITWTNDCVLLIGPIGKISGHFQSIHVNCLSRKSVWKYRLQNVGHFAQAWVFKAPA